MIWLNGEFLEESDARIPAQDSGLLVGQGVFETLRARNGQPFALDLHYQRLCKGAAIFSLTVPKIETLRAALIAVTRPDAQRLRITLTGGNNCLITAAALPDYSQPAKIQISSHLINDRSPLAGIKSTSYAQNLLILAEAKANGYDEALMANTKSHLCEGTTSNIFCIRDGQISTPPLTSGCLPGITRQLVIEYCQTNNIPIQETDIPITDLPNFDELFLTSTLREIQPVGENTPNTKNLKKSFQNWITESTIMT
jgi:branched-chain amino acid aminotransferase